MFSLVSPHTKYNILAIAGNNQGMRSHCRFNSQNSQLQLANSCRPSWSLSIQQCEFSGAKTGTYGRVTLESCAQERSLRDCSSNWREQGTGWFSANSHKWKITGLPPQEPGSCSHPSSVGTPSCLPAARRVARRARGCLAPYRCRDWCSRSLRFSESLLSSDCTLDPNGNSKLSSKIPKANWP